MREDGSEPGRADPAPHIDPCLRERLRRLGRLGREAGLPIYVVGGFVRDLLLGHPPGDLDLVVEGPAGSAARFARLLAGEEGGEVREHPDFLTAVVLSPEGKHLDVATARRESYPAPAALPRVWSASLGEDLRRRDFTVNTLTLRLWPGPFVGSEHAGPEILDPLGAQTDLDAGRLRLLHACSFLDDPTRILRGVRLEARFGWRMEPETLRLLAAARDQGIFDHLSPARLGHEVVRLLSDPSTLLPTLRRMAELGLLAVLHPRLAWSPALEAQLGCGIDAYRRHCEVEGTGPRLWLLALILLADSLHGSSRRELGLRLGLSGRDLRMLDDVADRRRAARALLGGPGVLAHQVDDALAPLEVEELLTLGTGEWVERHWTEQRRLVLGIGGRDLLARGAVAGRRLGEALRAVRHARLDDEISADEELDFALRWLGIE